MNPLYALNHTFIRFAFHICLAIVVVTCWEISVAENSRMAFVFGQPTGIVKEFVTLASTGELFQHIAATLTAAVLGWAIGTSFGTISGLLLATSQQVFRLFEPYILFLGSLPVFALGPLLVFWFGTGIASKIVLVAIATYAISLIQAFNGARKPNPKLLDLMNVHNASQIQIMLYVRAPTSIIWVIAGLRINVGMALIGAVIGEFIASRLGLGHLIIEGEGLYNMNRIWVGVLSTTFLAIILNSAVSLIERKVSSYSGHLHSGN